MRDEEQVEWGGKRTGEGKEQKNTRREKHTGGVEKQDATHVGTILR